MAAAACIWLMFGMSEFMNAPGLSTAKKLLMLCEPHGSYHPLLLMHCKKQNGYLGFWLARFLGLGFKGTVFLEGEETIPFITKSEVFCRPRRLSHDTWVSVIDIIVG